MARTKKGTPIRLLSVEEKAFRMDTQALTPDDNDALFGFNYSFSPDEEENTVAVFFEVLMYTNDMQELLLLDTVFNFKTDRLKKYLELDDTGQARLTGITKPLLEVAVATARGLLIGKTAGTPLSRFVLPLIDVTRMTRADI